MISQNYKAWWPDVGEIEEQARVYLASCPQDAASRHAAYIVKRHPMLMLELPSLVCARPLGGQERATVEVPVCDYFTWSPQLWKKSEGESELVVGHSPKDAAETYAKRAYSEHLKNEAESQPIWAQIFVRAKGALVVEFAAKLSISCIVTEADPAAPRLKGFSYSDKIDRRSALYGSRR